MSVSFILDNSPILSDVYLHRILNSINDDTTNGFTVKLHFDSNVDDSTIIILDHDGEEIRFTRYGENDSQFKVMGKKEDVVKLIKLLAIHASIIIAAELCKNAFTEEHFEKFKLSLREEFEKTVFACFDKCIKEE